MSIQAMAWALKQELVTDSIARHVLLCLANYAGQDGCAAFPSVSTLMADTRLSERTVRAKLDLLLAVGALRMGNQAIGAAYIERKDRRPVVYDLAIERGAPPAPRSVVDKSGDKSENGVHLTQERGAPPAPNTRALILKKGAEPVDKSTPRQKRRPPSETAGALRSINELFKTGA